MPDDTPLPSPLECEALDLLIGGGEMYGLELVRKSEGRLKRGTVYVMLGRMEDKGLVESRVEDSTPDQVGIPRRLYRPTGLGVRAQRKFVAVQAVLNGEFAT
jgi:DNA-binding PadR family transcriptional regulator